MENREQNRCDPEDVVCQIEVLRHLKGLNDQMGNEAFLEKYPEAVALKERLPAEITRQKEVVEKSIGACAGEEEEQVESTIHVHPTVVREEEAPEVEKQE